MSEPTQHPIGLRSARWGPVLIGAAAGLFFNFVVALLVFLATLLVGGSADSLGPLIVLAFALFSGLLFSGYTAGRFTSETNPGFHGSLAALALYGVVALLGILAGSPIDPITIALFAVVAVIIGFAGGTLAGRPAAQE